MDFVPLRFALVVGLGKRGNRRIGEVEMARITVDDCVKLIPNRFELTLVATTRARQLALGAAPYVEAGRDKPTVTALREIAAGHIGIEILKPVVPQPIEL